MKTPDRFAIEKLGLLPSAARVARACGFRDAQSLASKTTAELIDFGFSLRNARNIESCLSLIGLSLADSAAYEGRSIAPLIELQLSLTKKDATPAEESRPEAQGAPQPGDPIEGEYDPIQSCRKSARKAVTEVGFTRKTRTEASRALASAKSALRGPPRDDPRVAALRESLTMDVADAAFLYGVSPDVIYSSCRNPKNSSIPHQRFGTRIRILTRPVFAALGLD